MNKHDMHLGGMYLVLGASVGTYGAVAGVEAARYVGGMIGAIAAWYLCRAAVRFVRAMKAYEWQATDYSSSHYAGVTALTLGMLAWTQVSVGVMYESLAGLLVGFGGMYASAGLYERYKRGKTTS